MSDRRQFLKQLAAMSAFAVVGPVPRIGQWVPVRTDFLTVVQQVCFPALRYNVPGAWLAALHPTGDAAKYSVRVRGRSGVETNKTILVSTFAKSRGSLKSELAYSIAKRVRESARDIGHLEGIDWRRNELEWHA